MASSSTDELTAFARALSGQYEIEREIGRGGMGVVYLARDPRLERQVAIKTLPAARADDAGTRDRFLREARTVARLVHSNIVPIHRADEVDGHVFFVMGFVDGDSLASRLARSPLSPREAIPILRDVDAALGYAHRNGVVHRDVKTENILLDAKSGRALVTDFGIAWVTEAVPLTATGQILGTVYYLSPEQVMGGTIDARSDIYALGVVAYTALAGRFPFDGPFASAVLVAQVNSPAPPLSTTAPHVPASLASIVDRCLAKSPAHRFQTCADLDAALAAAQREAEQVTIVAPASRSPLLSDTEAQALLGRAAELQEMTDVRARPVEIPMRRDAERDALRTSGMRTAHLRDAAREAGIDDASMQRALEEHGLRPRSAVPGHGAPAGIVDLNREEKRFFEPPSAEIEMELVVDGEAHQDDLALLAEIMRRNAAADGFIGTAGSVGRTLTWSGRTPKRELEVSIAPHNGRTTIRVHETFKTLARGVWGGPVVAGGIFAFNMTIVGNAGMGMAIGGAVLAGGYAIAVSWLRSFARERKTTARDLLKALAAQVRKSDSRNRK